MPRHLEVLGNSTVMPAGYVFTTLLCTGVGFAIANDVVSPLVFVGILLACGAVVYATSRRMDVGLVLVGVGWTSATFLTESSIGGGFAESGGVGGAPLKVIPLFLTAVGTGMILWRTDARAGRTLDKCELLLLAYLSWLLLAAVATGASPLSLLRVIQSSIPAVAVLAVRRLDVRRHLLIWLTSVACVAHVLLGVVFPAGDSAFYLYTGRVTGYLVANAYTFAASVAFVFTLGLWLRGVKGGGPIFIVAGPLTGYAISASGGRTGLVAVAAAVLAALLARPEGRARTLLRARRKALTSWALVGLVPGLYLFGPQVVEWFGRGGVQEVSTLTGRTTLWSAVWESALRRPLFGSGPGSLRFDRVAELGDLFHGSPGSAHNSLLEALASGGFIGALLWLGFMVALGQRSFALKSEHRSLAIAFYAMLCVSSLTLGTMAGFGIGWYALMALVLMTGPSWPSGGEAEELRQTQRTNA